MTWRPLSVLVLALITAAALLRPSPTEAQPSPIFGLGTGAPVATTPPPPAVTGAVVPRTTFVRKDANSLPPAELLAYKEAVQEMLARNPGAGRASYQEYVEVHGSAARHGHGGPAFLPWHRYFLIDFERQLGMAIPYWDWTRPATNLFRSEFFGGPGNVTLSWTDAAGAAHTWSYDRQNFNADMVPVPPAMLDRATVFDDFMQFTQTFEGVHGSPHVMVGGHLGQVPEAVRDPMFFLLHSNVDRIWWEWQEERRRAFTPGTSGATFSYADSYWDGNITGAPPIWARRHGIDSLMWPWDGSNSDGGAGGSPSAAAGPSIARFAASPERVTPRDMLVSINSLGYRYE